MKYKLPPLNALKYFEAAARNLSFTKAAEELCITQGAISKQIKVLEEYLGFTLFTRIHQGLILTKKAEEYYQNIYLALDSIRISTHFISKKHIQGNVLRINTLPSLSSYWLIPRLKYFKEKYPDIELNIVGGGGNVDFSTIEADLAIRCLDKKIAGLENIKFMDEEMLMISSPEMATKIKTIDDIYGINIIEHSDRSFDLEEWISLSGLTNIVFKNKLQFEHFFMIIEAVKQSLGIAFVPSCLLDGLLKSGELVNLLNIKYKTKFAYCLLYPKESRYLNKVKIFREWLLDVNQNVSL